MKKFYLLSLLFLVMNVGFSQAEYVALPGGTELVKHEISAPDQTNYSFYDVIKNGNWNPNRELDFDSLNMTFKVTGHWDRVFRCRTAATGIFSWLVREQE